MSGFRGGNGTGPATIGFSREHDFAVFDSLPPEVRRALNDSWFCRTAAGVRPQLASVGVERVAVLLGPGGACDQALVREEQRQALERMGERRRPLAAGAGRERVY